mgnify:CR=1 FL=1
MRGRDEFRAANAAATEGNAERAAARLAEQGKRPVRHRIARLLDGGSFVEDALLANAAAGELAESLGALARYKRPRRFVFVDEVRRGPNGKADYKWAREVAATSSSS